MPVTANTGVKGGESIKAKQIKRTKIYIRNHKLKALLYLFLSTFLKHRIVKNSSPPVHVSYFMIY